MRTIILNKTNIVNNGKNNVLEYDFPSSVQFKDTYIAVKSVSMYYSWYNISQSLGNNTFSYTWYSGSGTETTHVIVIPDGMYEVTNINTFLQSKMIENGHYLIDNTNNKNIFFLELIVNPTRYAVQINTYQFKYLNNAAVVSAGYVLPSNFNHGDSGAFPSSTAHYFNPKISMASKFNDIVGYSSTFVSDLNINGGYTPPTNNSYISKDASTQTISYLSHDSTTLKTKAPDVQPNASILMNLTNIDNAYANPTGILYSIAPDVAFGALISEKTPELAFHKLIPGSYNQLRLQFLANNLDEIEIQDPNITIMLVIKERNEI